MPAEQRIYPRPEGQMKAALAEFSALRDEIISVRSVQKNVTSIALTAYAVVFSVAFASDGDRSLLLVLPPLGLGLCLVQLGETVTIGRIGSYIRKQVWPSVQQLSGYQHSWEDRNEEGKIFGAAAMVAFTDGIVPLMLTVAGGVALHLAPAPTGVRQLERWRRSSRRWSLRRSSAFRSCGRGFAPSVDDREFVTR